MEILNEIVYSITIINFLNYFKLSNKKDKEFSIFIKNKFNKTKENYGVKTLTELINFELTMPKPKKLYNKLSKEEKKDFWFKVKFIDKLI